MLGPEGGSWSPEVRGQEPTEAQAWSAWAEAWRERGVEVSVEKEGGKIVVEHVRGEKGVPGLGKDTVFSAEGAPLHRVWMGATREGRNHEGNSQNEKDYIEQGEEHPGVTVGEEGSLAKDHPVSQLLNGLLESGANVRADLVGAPSGWQPGEHTMLRRREDEDGDFDGFSVEVPEGQEFKLTMMFLDGRNVMWDAGGGDREGARQRLEIGPAPEKKSGE